MTQLRFRRAITGRSEEAEVRVDDTQNPIGEFLLARRVWLADDTELRQHTVTDNAHRSSGHDALDSEILAGRLLSEVAGWDSYPPEVPCLYGDEAASATPYALFEPYRGEKLSRKAVRQLTEDEMEAIQVSLLTGLCWLAAAGISHRALNPDTL
jgi:hypothetical protein